MNRRRWTNENFDFNFFLFSFRRILCFGENLFLREVYMHTGILVRFTDGASMEGGAAACAETEVPARQQ